MQVKEYYLEKLITSDKMETLKNTYVKRSQIKLIIDHDADVYDKNGKLLLKFRKNVLNNENVEDFYDNVIKFAKNTSSNRGSTSGSTKKNIWENPKVMSNILGYFDKFSPIQKMLMRGKKIEEIRETRFNMDYPEKFKKLVPLINEIDELYKKYTPDYYKKQKKKADETHFKIPGTSFTTITTNVNFQTSIHKDKGDDMDGFGNLAVIEKGEYTGGETCFPQYGLGVDVRTNDILFMDVHEWHGNLPIHKKGDAIRLSIVCYLRYNVWKNSKGKSKSFMIKHNKTIKNLRK